MHEKLSLEVVPGNRLSPQARGEILTLCSQAFEEDYAPYLETFDGAVHILARRGGKLVSQALWVTRWLQVGDDPPLRTAYVEGVATAADFQGQGFATAVMKRLAKEIVVWTQDEVAEWRDVPNAFITTVLNEGLVVYERPT